MKSQNAIFCLIGAGALALSAVPAFAVPTSDTLQLYINNVPAASVSAPEDATESGLYFIPGVPIDPTQFGRPFEVVEPDNSISDIYGIANVGGNLELAFMSDPIDLNAAILAFGPMAGWVQRPEIPGQVMNAEQFLDPIFRNTAPANATFTSDGDTVPDGGLTVALLGFALAGMEGLRRKLGSR